MKFCLKYCIKPIVSLNDTSLIFSFLDRNWKKAIIPIMHFEWEKRKNSQISLLFLFYFAAAATLICKLGFSKFLNFQFIFFFSCSLLFSLHKQKKKQWKIKIGEVPQTIQDDGKSNWRRKKKTLKKYQTLLHTVFLYFI